MYATATSNTVLEPAVVPLLRAMYERRGKSTRVFDPFPTPKDLAERLRQYLEWAGVERTELFTTDATRKNVTFHDLRATGITWACIRGDGVDKIQFRAGHATLKTTLDYVREAEAVGAAGLGQVFASLEALETDVRSRIGLGEMVKAPEPLDSGAFVLCEEGDLNLYGLRGRAGFRGVSSRLPAPPCTGRGWFG